AIKTGLVTAAHDISDGGLATTLAEMAIFGKKGAEVSVETLSGSKHEVLFSEAQSGVVITIPAAELQTAKYHFEKANVPMFELGVVKGDSLEIKDLVSLNVSAAETTYESAIPKAMEA
ncbi:MAG TPA: phosphoribosylformylglycinamidine synthase subunit PurL, partial [Balneolaceae bacterium]|nr:phosphoribosylformylglycinamidine synthase subunit PurL [Balneolaceae bacterium]